MEVAAIGGVVTSEGTSCFRIYNETLIVTFIVTLFNSYGTVIPNGKWFSLPT